MVTVADCQRVQTNWYRVRAQTLGGEIWTDGPLTWIDGPDGQNLMFPTEMTTAAVLRGVERARQRGLGIVGAWLDRGVDATPLAEAGFDRGWSPWWMTADLSGVIGRPDPRIELHEDTTDYQDEDPGYRELLALARLRPRRAWYAAAYTSHAKRFAGRAWSFLDGTLAGVFDMDVWEPFRRRGFGTGLLNAVCTAARQASAQHAVLNATPEGKHLYSACGFTQIGEGTTWWCRLAPGAGRLFGKSPTRDSSQRPNAGLTLRVAAHGSGATDRQATASAPYVPLAPGSRCETGEQPDGRSHPADP
jgi:GNAT superfamily N-acetyltransferase